MREIPEGCITNMRTAMTALGFDMSNQHFAKTPERFLKYLEAYHRPYDPAEDLGTSFQVEGDFHAMVVESGIPFTGVCAHHLIPFIGTATIGYVPRGRIVGLSKLVRVIEGIAHRLPSTQESISDDTVDAIMQHLGPVGAMVVITAEHGCMGCRGVARPGIVTATSSVRGVFRDVPQARMEFFELARRQ